MAGTPSYKVYTPAGEYVAACKQPEDAAAVCSLHGEGSTIRWQHGPVLYIWGPGSDNSYDAVAEAVHIALSDCRQERAARSSTPMVIR